jgi:hypothetical protein
VTRAGVAADAPRVIAMTDARTYRAHLVTDTAAAAGRAAVGRCVAVCGTVVLAASPTTPDVGFCRACVHWRQSGIDNGISRARAEAVPHEA